MRWKRYITSAVLILAFALFATMTFPPFGINLGRFEHIEIGMTQKEVDAIIGSKGKVPIVPDPVGWAHDVEFVKEDPTRRIWTRGEITITIELDAHGRVGNKSYVGPPDSYFDHLRHILTNSRPVR